MAVGQKYVPKMGCPGKWRHELKPAVPGFILTHGHMATHLRTYFSGWIESEVHWGFPGFGLLTHGHMAVNNLYPRSVALVNGNMYDLTCGPFPGGFILAHTHLA